NKSESFAPVEREPVTTRLLQGGKIQDIERAEFASGGLDRETAAAAVAFVNYLEIIGFRFPRHGDFLGGGEIAAMTERDAVAELPPVDMVGRDFLNLDVLKIKLNVGKRLGRATEKNRPETKACDFLPGKFADFPDDLVPAVGNHARGVPIRLIAARKPEVKIKVGKSGRFRVDG